MKEFIKINPLDTVAVALQPLPKGKQLTMEDSYITLVEDIPQGHKFSLNDQMIGDHVVKYGESIGHATQKITVGSWVHTHNMKTNLGEKLTYSYNKVDSTKYDQVISSFHPLNPFNPTLKFQGYRRHNGKVGIRNDIWIIPTVGCVNGIAKSLEQLSKLNYDSKENGVVAFTHNYGCSQMGEDQENTRKILADLIQHPNAGAVLVLGLGCENTSIEVLHTYLDEIDETRIKFLQVQDVEDEIAVGMELLRELTSIVAMDQREAIHVNELIIGMKCGGSDGLSGITANPTVGVFSDLLIAQGGSTILTEVPEMFGAEKELMNRCANELLFQQTVNLINDFKQYFTDHKQTIYENPSPGNKDGGISTLEDKSLGCTQKSGTAFIQGVLAYGEPLKTKGLNLLNSPGNDLVAATALAASGAHMVLFTTGRGTPFASPVPTVKISSNSKLGSYKNNWIDFDCGSLLEDTTMMDLAYQLFEYVVRVASGEQCKSEVSGYQDFAIFKDGVTL